MENTTKNDEKDPFLEDLALEVLQEAKPLAERFYGKNAVAIHPGLVGQTAILLALLESGFYEELEEAEEAEE